MLRSVPRKRASRGIVAVALGLTFVVVGAYFVWLVAVTPALQAREARGWTETTCRIVHSEVTQHRDSDGNVSHRLLLAYRVLTPAGEVPGDRPSFRAESADRSATYARQRALAPGRVVRCFHDPADPRRSVLDRDVSTSPLAIFPMLFVAAGLASIGGGIAAGFGRAPGPAPAPGGGVRLVRRGRPWFSVGLLGANALVAWAAAIPVALVGIGIGEALFLALAGGVTLWFAHALGAALARLEVTIDRDAVRPGDPATVRWQVGAPFGARRVTATLVGREVVTRSVGDSSTTETRAIVEQALDGDGAATIAIPPGAMASQPVPPFQFDWHLRIVADLPWWPDLKAELALDVVAGAPDPRDERGAGREGDAPPPAGPLILAEGRTRFAPGERIEGELAWTRDRPPRDARVTLQWIATAGDDTHVEPVGVASVAELPRVVVPRDAADPYRSSAVADGAPAPLAAGERRRLRFTAPEAPPSYDGALFELAWQLEVAIDGEVVQTVPIVIGPGRAAVIARLP